MRADDPGPVRSGLARYRVILVLALGLVTLYALSRPQKTPSVTLAFLGDVMLGRGVAAAHPEADWASALAALKPELSHADLILANLESPLTNSPSQVPPGGYDLRASPKAVEALVSAHIGLVSLANNHRLDGGEAGLAETRLVLHSNGIGALLPEPGAWNTTIHGVKLAILAYDGVSAPIDVARMKQEVTLAHSSDAFVIVSFHWGGEYRAGPEPGQVTLAQTLADSGAGLVWGHHPHVLQPLAWISGAAQPQRALIAYSLGNALFDQPTPPDARRGAVLLVTLDQERILSVRTVPFEIDTHLGVVKSASPELSALICQRLGKVACP
jgi:poly-gamma-glutamate synthesis protein (capsule biosynthesis protein)